MSAATGVCPICREPAAGAAQVMPSGALVALEPCAKCAGELATRKKPKRVQIAGSPREVEGGGWKKCAGRCGRVLSEHRMNTVSRRGKRPQSVCGDCLLGVVSVTAEQIN